MRCKCVVTGEIGTTDTFYYASDGNFYKSEQVYLDLEKEKSYANSLCPYILKEFLKEKYNKNIYACIGKFLSDTGIKKIEIYNYLSEHKAEILASMPSKDCDTFTKLSYISSCIKKGIGKTTQIGCYAIINKESHEVYIGESINLFQRFATHVSDLYENKHHCKKLQEAFNKTQSMSSFSIYPIFSLDSLCVDKWKLKEETLYMEAAYYLLYKSKGTVFYNTKDPYLALKNDDVYVRDQKVNSINVLRLLYDDKYKILNKDLSEKIKKEIKELLGESLNKNTSYGSFKSARTLEIEESGSSICTLDNMQNKVWSLCGEFYSYDLWKQVLIENNIIYFDEFKEKKHLMATQYAIENDILYLESYRIFKYGLMVDHYAVSEKGQKIILDLFMKKCQKLSNNI